MFQFVQIGKILKPYQNAGELLCVIESAFFEDLSKCKAIFLSQDGLEIPFFIENMELDEESCILKLEEFNAPEDVKPYNGQSVYLRTEDIKIASAVNEKIDFSKGLEGFIIHDLNSNTSVTIESVEQFPQQLMATVFLHDQQFLIPLVEDFIESIDAENQKITMNLPDGLLEL